MQISYFSRKEERVPVVRMADWPREFLGYIEARSDDASEKTRAPLFTCDLFRAGGTRGAGTSKANIEAVAGLVLDYDAKHEASILAVEEVWAGYDFVLYTTFNHGLKGPGDSFRVIIPFAEPLPVADYERFLVEFAQPFSMQKGVRLETLTVGHPGFFYPTRRPGASWYAKHHPGVRLDAKAVVAELPARSNVHPMPPRPPVPPPPAPTNEPAAPAPVDIFRGMATAHEVADLGQIEAHCAFLRHGRENAAKLSEPEWRSWLSVVARCYNGREQAHAISSAYSGYRYGETETKIESLLTESGPHTCAHIEQNFPGCAECPLKGKIPGPLYVGKILSKSSAQSTDDVVRAAERLQRKLKFEDEIEDAYRALTQAQTREAEAKIALSLRKRLARSAPKAGALDGEDPEVLEAMAAEREAKRAVSDAKKALASAERKAKQRSTLFNPDPEVLDALKTDPYGRPEKGLDNLDAIFRRDSTYSDAFSFDVFNQKTRYEGKFFDQMTETSLRIAISRSYGFEPSGTDVEHVANSIAFEHQMHPVREYLRSQSWDGVDRLHELMMRGFGCVPSSTQTAEYLADVGQKLCVSLVARVMDPKAKNEVVVIAQGSQGKGKSTAFKTLCPNLEWFSDSHLKLSDKDAYMAIQGKWIYEIAELSSFKKSEQEAIKAFVSSFCDNFRPPFGKYTIQQYRSTVFVATTNDDQFLDDPTGDRRWAPVTTGVVDLNWIRANVNQLWAEAVVRYDSGAKWWYEGTEEARRAKACRPFKVEDAWTDTILQKIFETTNDGFYTVDRILTNWLNVPLERISRMEKNRVTRIMTQLGLPYVRLQQMKVALEQGYTFSPRGYWVNADARKHLSEEYAPNVLPFTTPAPAPYDEVF